jgi:hypothetical protein
MYMPMLSKDLHTTVKTRDKTNMRDKTKMMRDEMKMTRDETKMTRDETKMTDETKMMRDEMKMTRLWHGGMQPLACKNV